MTTIANLASRAPKAYGVLHRLNLAHRRSRASRVASRAGWIGAGIAVGSGLTLLLMSRSGQEMREYLGERATRARDHAVTTGSEPTDRASAALAPSSSETRPSI
jgi:hypothetical protein